MDPRLHASLNAICDSLESLVAKARKTEQEIIKLTPTYDKQKSAREAASDTISLAESILRTLERTIS